MIRRFLAASLTLCLVMQAGLTVYAWLPAATYQAIAAGTAYRLVDSVNSTALRLDQLGAGAAVSDTDTIEFCQGCGSSTSSVKVLASAVATYIANKMTGQQNAWVGQQLTPHTLTNASNIAVDLSTSNVHTIQLTGTGQTLQNPTGLTSGKEGSFIFRIQQPNSSGPYDLNWDTRYWFPAGTPPKQSNGGLSACNGCVDQFACEFANNSGTYTGYCPFNGNSNFASSSQFLLQNNHVEASGLAATISNSMAGALRTVELFACSNGACTANAGITRASSVTDGVNACSPVANAFYAGANGSSVDIWVCPKIVGSATATITASYGAQTVSFPCIFVQEWMPSTVSPDAGLGAVTQNASSSNPSYSLSGSTTQAGQLAISILNDGSAPTANVGTLIDTCASTTIVQYQTPSAGTVTNSATATAGRWSASMAAFQHY